MKNMRRSEKEYYHIKDHPDFRIVEKGEEDVFIVAIGARSGTVMTDPMDYDHFTPEHHIFLKANDQQVIQNLLSLQEELQEIANVTARVRGCGLYRIIDTYTNKYGRRNRLTSHSQ